MAQLPSDITRNVSQGGCHLRVEDDLEVILAQRNVTLLQWEALAEDLGELCGPQHLLEERGQ